MSTRIDSHPLLTTAEFSTDQKRYLESLFSSIDLGAISFRDLAPTPEAELVEELTKEEQIKQECHPLDATERIVLNAAENEAPAPTDVFRFKWNGLFWLNPVKDGYMCRLRIPGGAVSSSQLRELSSIARELTTGYIQITTRNNLQLRLIAPKDCPEVLRRIQGCGLHSRGAGGDNIRNITTNPTAGFDPYELIDTMPLVRELGLLLVSSREFYDLPRKFNIAFDGGGLVSSVEDTNDIGCAAVRVEANPAGIEPGIYFRLLLGGVTGHQSFAKDAGVLVPPSKINRVILAMLRVYIAEGDRTNRKKARLKHLLDRIGIPAFLEKTAALLPFPLQRKTDRLHEVSRNCSQQQHGHVGIYPEREPGMFYIGASVPVGQLTADQLEGISAAADHFGRGEIRLTVWQNFILPHVSKDMVAEATEALAKLGFSVHQSPLTSGFVACTGNRYCKFAATDTKGHAIAMMNYLDKCVTLDQPINIHFTGCPHSCAQHFMGDIGLLGAKVKVGEQSVEGYHITVGGGYGENQKVGRQVFSGVPYGSLGVTLASMLKAYLRLRASTESFQQFCNRHTIEELQKHFVHDS